MSEKEPESRQNISGPERLSADSPGQPVIDETLFRLLAENIPTLCWMANGDGYIIWYNRRWHEYCGSTPEQMEGWGWQSVHDPDVLPSVLARWTGSIAAGGAFEMTFPLRGADGVFRPFLTRIAPVRDHDGVVKWWFGVNTDVSAQVAAETELRTVNIECQAIAAERTAILDQLGEGVIVTDPTGRIKYVNDAATRLHGVGSLDVDPDGYAEAYSLLTADGDPHPTETLPLTRAVRHHETIVDARWKIRRPDGSEVLALGNAKPIYGEDKSLIGAVLTIRDDTLRHAAEEAMAQAVRIKDVMLQEVNHRVKNNLQLVTSLLSLQADRTTQPEVAANLIEARTRVGVVAGLHQRLYTTTQNQSVDLSDYLNEIARETLAAIDRTQKIALEFTAHENFLIRLDDAVPIALVINELLTNAVKYAFADAGRGAITITMTRRDGDVCLLLTDDGKGLPDGFDPGRSTGLGMLIVSALVGQVGGTLTVAAPQTGAAFEIMLPASRFEPINGA